MATAVFDESFTPVAFALSARPCIDRNYKTWFRQMDPTHYSIALPELKDSRGSLSFFETSSTFLLDFGFITWGQPSTALSHWNQFRDEFKTSFVVSLHGQFCIEVRDETLGNRGDEIDLSHPATALLIGMPSSIELVNATRDAVALIAGSR